MHKWEKGPEVAIPKGSSNTVIRTAYEGDVEVSTIHLNSPDIAEENGQKTVVRSIPEDTTQVPVITGNLREKIPELDTTQTHHELALEDITKEDIGPGSATL
jgi:hypothetical protein